MQTPSWRCAKDVMKHEGVLFSCNFFIPLLTKVDPKSQDTLSGLRKQSGNFKNVPWKQ